MVTDTGYPTPMLVYSTCEVQRDLKTQREERNCFIAYSKNPLSWEFSYIIYVN